MQQKTSLTWGLEQNDDKIILRLGGVLTRDTLLPLWEQRSSFLSKIALGSQPIIWELQALTRIDSAGFALFCDYLYQMQKQGQPQQLVNVPKQLLTLADLFGLSHWIKPFLL